MSIPAQYSPPNAGPRDEAEAEGHNRSARKAAGPLLGGLMSASTAPAVAAGAALTPIDAGGREQQRQRPEACRPASPKRHG